MGVKAIPFLGFVEFNPHWNMIMRKLITAVMLASISMASFANTITANPSTWKIQYIPANAQANIGAEVILYNTGSTCSPSASMPQILTLIEGYNGQTASDLQALMNFISAAKAAGNASVTFTYNQGSVSCGIQSFQRN